MKLSNLAILVGFMGLLVSFWNRNNLPRDAEFQPEVLAEPRQTATKTRPFDATFNGVDYLVEPEYEYDLAGMVVSFRHHDGNSRMHFRANDHLNMMDVCVVWGDSATSKLLHKLKFWNGIFTCNVKTRNQAAWDAFSMYQISNNHLISDDDYLRDKVKDIRIGDQIRVRGYLASYSNEDGGKRGTSTIRTDTGDGACETLYVEKFDIIGPTTSFWRISLWVSLAILAIGLFVHFRRPYRPY